MKNVSKFYRTILEIKNYIPKSIYWDDQYLFLRNNKLYLIYAYAHRNLCINSILEFHTISKVNELMLLFLATCLLHLPFNSIRETIKGNIYTMVEQRCRNKHKINVPETVEYIQIRISFFEKIKTFA